jgi:hypothetical protein
MMTVYIDQLRPLLRGTHRPKPFRQDGAKACHLMADSDDELESFAATLGLRKTWRHGDHYDLTANKRREALIHGAIEVDSCDMVRLRKSRR